jgi:hypothetical protein
MLYQVFAINRSTNEMLSEPFYIKAQAYIVAFNLAESMFGEFLQIKSCLPEEDHI